MALSKLLSLKKKEESQLVSYAIENYFFKEINSTAVLRLFSFSKYIWLSVHTEKEEFENGIT